LGSLTVVGVLLAFPLELLRWGYPSLVLVLLDLFLLVSFCSVAVPFLAASLCDFQVAVSKQMHLRRSYATGIDAAEVDGWYSCMLSCRLFCSGLSPQYCRFFFLLSPLPTSSRYQRRCTNADTMSPHPFVLSLLLTPHAFQGSSLSPQSKLFYQS
jgi:hypothetical protein